MHILILAGGGGTRLWPLSRQDFPKQFLQFGDHQSLLQKCVSRFLRFPGVEKVAISTNVHYEPLVRKQLEKIGSAAQIIVEPARKNTAPAIAFAVKYFREKLGAGEDASLLVVPSDHFIEPEELFFQGLKEAECLVREGHLVLFGIQPTKPDTGFGYIRVGKPYNAQAHFVEKFVEKPDQGRAEAYVASGEYYWNMGMFAFSIGVFQKKLSTYAPEIALLMEGTLEDARERFGQMPNISFDYAILEKCDSILMCPLPVRWSDVGSWDNVYEVMEKDENRNVKIGNVVDIETENSLIIGGKKLISTIGLKDILIVETDEGIFIAQKGHSQKVKELVNELKKKAAYNP